MSVQATLFEVVPLDKLKPASDNPRRSVGDVAELAASIQAVGIWDYFAFLQRHGYEASPIERQLLEGKVRRL